jgi:hypothetical protein
MRERPLLWSALHELSDRRPNHRIDQDYESLFLISNTFVPMPIREVPEKFLIAFSLAGEQRNLARSIAEAVEQELGPATVFLDEWFEHFIAGHDADLKLQRIYGKQCECLRIRTLRQTVDSRRTRSYPRSIDGDSILPRETRRVKDSAYSGRRG